MFFDDEPMTGASDGGVQDDVTPDPSPSAENGEESAEGEGGGQSI